MEAKLGLGLLWTGFLAAFLLGLANPSLVVAALLVGVLLAAALRPWKLYQIPALAGLATLFVVVAPGGVAALAAGIMVEGAEVLLIAPIVLLIVATTGLCRFFEATPRTKEAVA